MKRNLILIVMLVIFCFANLAYAAADPFSDVPAKHWAYDAINKLAKAGIVNGYDDGTFRGDKVISRYEMAIIVGNAMTKFDKASDENKILINKLAVEFADELKAMGKRVDSLEKKQGPLKIDGFMIEQFNWTQNPRELAQDAGFAAPASLGRADAKNVSQTIVWLNVQNQFDGNTYFKGVFAGQYVGGQGTEGALEIKESYFGGKLSDNTELKVGRMWPIIGEGLLYATPYSDGIGLSMGGNVKVNLYTVKFGNTWVSNPNDYSTVNRIWPLFGNDFPYPATHATWSLADAKFTIAPKLDLSLAYSKDNLTGMDNVYNEYAVGFNYAGIQNISLKGEWGHNSSGNIKGLYNLGFGGKDYADAYYIQAKYKGANPFQVGSFGALVTYVYADPGFDPMGQADGITHMPINWSSPSGGNIFDNVKGFEYGIEATIWPRVIFDVRYGAMKMNDTTHPLMPVEFLQEGQNSQKYVTAQFFYLF